jgi:hypothetical protein
MIKLIVIFRNFANAPRKVRLFGGMNEQSNSVTMRVMNKVTVINEQSKYEVPEVDLHLSQTGGS